MKIKKLSAAVGILLVISAAGCSSQGATPTPSVTVTGPAVPSAPVTVVSKPIVKTVTVKSDLTASCLAVGKDGRKLSKLVNRYYSKAEDVANQYVGLLQTGADFNALTSSKAFDKSTKQLGVISDAMDEAQTRLDESSAKCK